MLPDAAASGEVSSDASAHSTPPHSQGAAGTAAAAQVQHTAGAAPGGPVSGAVPPPPFSQLPFALPGMPFPAMMPPMMGMGMGPLPLSPYMPAMAAGGSCAAAAAAAAGAEPARRACVIVSCALPVQALCQAGDAHRMPCH
jgi:hypothetical protein